MSAMLKPRRVNSNGGLDELPIQDGQLIFDTANQKLYLDNQNDRLPFNSNLNLSSVVMDSQNQLHFYDQNNADVVDPVDFSNFSGGSGGGGGGSSSDNGAKLTVSNTTGWLSKTIASGESAQVKITWSSIEDNLPTGNGTIRVLVNGLSKATINAAQGQVTIDVTDYLSSGSNSVKVVLSDVYQNTRTINFTIQILEISISSSFDANLTYSGSITFPYVPVGSIYKKVHIEVDNNEIAQIGTAISGGQLTYTIPQQNHGAHTIRCWFTCIINGETVSSNILYYEIICLQDDNSTPIITTQFNTNSVNQYSTINIPYSVYVPNTLTADITISVNGEVVSEQTVGRAQQAYSMRIQTAGVYTVIITCGDTSKTIRFTAIASEIETAAVLDSLALYLTADGRSNNQSNPGQWNYNNISATFTDFNYNSDGWQSDEDGITVLRVLGNARVNIPYQIFAKDFRTTGKTIEIQFATRDVLNYDSTILSCVSDGRGLTITPQLAKLKSEQSEISTQYKQNEHVRISFVIEKRSENRLIYCYINGIISGVVQYADSDVFSQLVPVDITIGSNDCTIDVYNIRIYDNDLTRYQIVDNWIADTQNGTQLLERYERNNIFDDYGKIVISKLPTYLPYMTLVAQELPQYKGDKKTISGSYVDPSNPSNNFTFEGAEFNVQGTSSQYYARKNYKAKFKKGFILSNGSASKTYAIRGEDNCIPTNTFTFKADVASSEGANNVELVRLYNDATPYKTPPQRQNSLVRQGIDGFPIVIFWNNGSETTFIGKYNFNNDKGTEEVFGFAEGDESWEIKNNTSDRVLWKNDSFVKGEWQNDFQGRYPEDNDDTTNLQALAAWLKTTDQSQATGAALGQTVDFGQVQYETQIVDGKEVSVAHNITYTNDTAAYRLAKFKYEFDDHMERKGIFFYYLFTELFLMVDSRAKNMFPSFLGADKWTSLPYDFDTAIGINNQGDLAFSYNLEDIDKTQGGADVFNGQDSVLWINVRQAFFDEIKQMYQSLRSSNTLSYQVVEKMFEDHQSYWSEAIFNQDAYFKYIQPLITDNTDSYLPMCQGSKAEQRKWWLYNRFKYLDSKYNAGDSLTDIIQVRGYAKSDITVTPYADIYAAIKYGSYLVQERAGRNSEVTLACPLDNVNDTEIYIYSASQLASVGDLSGLKVGFADFSKATKIQSIKLGDYSSDYQNGNLKTLGLGNNTLLKSLDIRNCVNLTGSLEISGCSNIEEIYATGTSISAINLPVGGVLKTLYLPSTVSNLTIRGQSLLTDLSIPSYENITTLRLEDNGTAIDDKKILKSIKAGSNVRLINFYWECDSDSEISDLMDILDTMSGIDENGNIITREYDDEGNLTKRAAQVSGTIHVPNCTATNLAIFNAKYPSVTIKADYVDCVVQYYNFEGTELIYTERVRLNRDASYAGAPAKEATAYNSYIFLGWSYSPNSITIDSNAQKKVTQDRVLYAAYSIQGQTFTVQFYNDNGTLLQTVKNVPYGGSAAYTGETPVSDEGSVDEYVFLGWTPSNENITKDISCYAYYSSPYTVAEIDDSWEAIVAAIKDGTYQTKYKPGNYKTLNLGDFDIQMEVVGKNKDPRADGRGKAPMTFIAKNVLLSKYKMNSKDVEMFPSYIVSDNDAADTQNGGGSAWVQDTESGDLAYKTNFFTGVPSSTATAVFAINPKDVGTLTIEYKIGTEANYDFFTLKVNDDFITSRNSGVKDWTAADPIYYQVGDTITVTATYTKDASNDYNGDTCYVRFSGISSTEISMVTGKGTHIGTTFTDGTGSIGGWPKCELRTKLQSEIKALMPDIVKNNLVEVTKYTRTFNADGTITENDESQDEIWIPSISEMLGSKWDGSSAVNYRTVFSDNASRIRYATESDTQASDFWLRTYFDYAGFAYFYSTGASFGGARSSTSQPVIIGFCL